MQPTLRAVLASDALRAGAPEVLSGSDRLDARVRWVHVGEVPDVADLLRGGELILSTGLAMHGAPEEAAAYLDALVAAGAVGLVVELGPRFPQVPPAVLARARQHAFPVVALHRRVRFVEVTEEVHRAIVAEQLAQVEFAREVHETFTRLSLEEADPATIVTTTAQLCGASVVLEDLGHRVLAHAAVGRPAAGLLADWQTRSRAAPTLDATGLSGAEGWMTTPVGGRGAKAWGRLVAPETRVPQARLATVLERAAQALELGRMVARDRTSLTLQAQGGLLGELASGRLADEETARARASALGLPAARRYVAVVAHLGSPVERDTAPDATRDEMAAQERTRGLLDRLGSAMDTAGLGGLVGITGSQVGLLLALPIGRAGPERAEADALTSLARALADPEVTLGVGPAADSLVGAGAGLRTAAHNAEVAAAMPGERRPFYRTADIGLYGLLAQLHDDPRLQAFVEAELGPLLDHEARRGDGLLDLLRAYVAAGGNKTRMAANTHRSRPGVYKKLAQLERVLGADLDDPATWLALGVALLAHEQSARL